ncbi:DUF917 family protein [Paludibacterium yongneupense]|uniref:S-methyl thiohydantoin desulfurase domain-containing protein n=1 Tax=Paludibacterium yongneupense TaxID=400061 RepID=UPI0003FFE75B|nr:DUF917 family protein [Paludibacterium yongneupense]
MTESGYGIEDFYHVAAGAAVLASGGGGSYHDARQILDAFAATGWQGTVPVGDYDGASACAVLAVMGSPDAAQSMTLADITYSITNTVNRFEQATATALDCVIPVEIGPINSIVPLIAAARSDNTIAWVVDGDGAGRAVPQLPQTTYAGRQDWDPSPCALANDADTAGDVESAVLNADSAARVETLAGGVVSAFGSFAGIALWPSNAGNNYALTGNYLAGTLGQARELGRFMSRLPQTQALADKIVELTGRHAVPLLTNFYITSITQSTTGASLDTGTIRLDNTADPQASSETHYLYNLNESLILYSSQSTTPDALAPDSICYYCESTGQGFSNASDDLAPYFDSKTGNSTGVPISVIKVAAAPRFYTAPGVLASFAGLLRDMGYAGALPYSV